MYAATSRNFVILLHPGEYITKVEVCYTDDVVKAIRLRSNKRTWPWFGETQGSRVAFEAEEGFIINALRGKYGPDGCSELGVVFAPKAMADEGDSRDMPSFKSNEWTANGDDDKEDESDKREEEDDEEDDEEDVKIDLSDTIRTFDSQARAIVVLTSDKGVGMISMITALEYGRIERFPDSFEWYECEENEHWLVLVDGERLKAVGLEIEHNRIKSVCFKTTLRTSHRFGTTRGGELTWLSCDDDACIDGIEVEENQHGIISRVAVLWSEPTKALASEAA